MKLEHFTLSHRLRHAGKGTVPASVNESSQEADIKAWTDELATIKDHLQPHGLSFVTLPITFFTSIAQLEDPCTSKLEDLITQIRRSHGSGVRIGLDFSSQVLYNADEETTISYLNLIQYLYRMSYNDSGFYFPLECMTVACNAFTYEKASQMMSLGRSITIPVAATEIVRAHPRRIGTITLPHDRFAPSSVDAVDKTAAMAYGSPSQSKQQDDDFDEPLPHDPQDKALVLLNRSLKSCLSMEKQYMSRFDPPPVPITDVCWAHIIISTFQSVAKPIEETNETKTKDDINSNTNRNRNLILFAEEWEYNLRTRINPVFESAMTTLEKNSAETADFRVLYKPLANILFRSYTDALKVSVYNYK